MLLLIAMLTSAVPPMAGASDRAQALQELASPSGDSVLATPATVEIRQNILAREDSSSRWSLGLFLQSFEPGGMGSIRGVGDYQLTNLKTSPMFRLEGRWHLYSWEMAQWSFLPQLSLQSSYSSQDVKLVTATGFHYQRTRLSTFLSSVAYRLAFRHHQWPLLEPSFGFGFGQALNFQTSRSDSATFSKNSPYWLVNAGFRWFLKGQWSVELIYEQRGDLGSNPEVHLQNSNLMAGLIWGRGQ